MFACLRIDSIKEKENKQSLFTSGLTTKDADAGNFGSGSPSSTKIRICISIASCIRSFRFFLCFSCRDAIGQIRRMCRNNFFPALLITLRNLCLGIIPLFLLGWKYCLRVPDTNRVFRDMWVHNPHDLAWYSLRRHTGLMRLCKGCVHKDGPCERIVFPKNP